MGIQHARAAIALGTTLFAQCTWAEIITLTTGETLTVSILELTDESVRFVHPVLGELTLPRAAVTNIAASPVDQTLRQAASAPDVPAAAVSQDRWSFKLVMGTGAATGNTENANFTSVITATRQSPRIKTVLDAGYFFAQSDGDRSQNRFTAGGRNDWLNPDSKWFYFADARYEYDEFQSWD